MSQHIDEFCIEDYVPPDPDMLVEDPIHYADPLRTYGPTRSVVVANDPSVQREATDGRLAMFTLLRWGRLNQPHNISAEEEHRWSMDNMDATRPENYDWIHRMTVLSRDMLQATKRATENALHDLAFAMSIETSLHDKPNCRVWNCVMRAERADVKAASRKLRLDAAKTVKKRERAEKQQNK